MAGARSTPRRHRQRRKRPRAAAEAGHGSTRRAASAAGALRSAGGLTENPLLGTVGERPAGLFGGVPVSEVAILGGIVLLAIGLIWHGGLAMDLGALLCGLGVLEVTAREHFSGFRSHTLLLSLIPAIALEVLLALLVELPTRRVLLLVPVLPLFGGCFLLLRHRFRVARHARIVGRR